MERLDEKPKLSPKSVKIIMSVAVFTIIIIILIVTLGGGEESKDSDLGAVSNVLARPVAPASPASIPASPALTHSTRSMTAAELELLASRQAAVGQTSDASYVPHVYSVPPVSVPVTYTPSAPVYSVPVAPVPVAPVPVAPVPVAPVQHSPVTYTVAAPVQARPVPVTVAATQVATAVSPSNESDSPINGVVSGVMNISHPNVLGEPMEYYGKAVKPFNGQRFSLVCNENADDHVSKLIGYAGKVVNGINVECHSGAKRTLKGTFNGTRFTKSGPFRSMKGTADMGVYSIMGKGTPTEGKPFGHYCPSGQKIRAIHGTSGKMIGNLGFVCY